MRKKIFIIILIVILIVIASVLFVAIRNYKIQEQNTKRYEEIKKDIDTELKRYMYVIAPKCYPGNGTPLLTHQDLVYNGGMDKEKLLDVDGKSYCKVYIKTKCVEIGKWDWKIFISCKDYTDKEYIEWAE
ncbi:MAG: hypothetical protein J6A89_03530 [Clostridia bacterium]|nr:hypothetical protein [Clostridia bacterium]